MVHVSSVSSTDLLNFRVNSQGDAVAARAQLVFHLCTVLAGVFQIVQLKETVDNVGHRIFHVVRILIHPVALGSGSLQHIRRGGIQRLLILLPSVINSFSYMQRST